MGANKKVTKVRRTLADNILRLREQANISQERLAEGADMHRTYIGSVERSQRNIGIDGVERIAKVLKVKTSQWLEEQ